LEQPAANADAIEFLIPLMVALLDDFPPLVFIGLAEICDEGMDTEAAWILVRVATTNQMERILILPMFQRNQIKEIEYKCNLPTLFGKVVIV
jgi:hypothetical protein